MAPIQENVVYSSWRLVDKAEFQKRWPNFSPEELACKGTGKVMFNFRALDLLQKLRVKLGRPILLNSAFRSPEHNRAVGGATNSFHMKAMAFDCRMTNHNPEEFERAAVEVGFRGVGHYPSSNFMHVDARQTSSVVRWKGTGANNKWFFSASSRPAGLMSSSSASSAVDESFGEDGGEQDNVVPNFTSPTVPSLVQTIKELAPILIPAIVGPLAALSTGSGPVQWAFGASLIILAVGGFLWLRKGIKQGSESENA